MSGRWFIALPVVLGILLWFSKGTVEQRLEHFSRPTPVVDIQTAQFYGHSAKKFSLGFDCFLADLAWVALLQGASHEPMKGAGVSWEYALIRRINTLDPRFTRAYWFGASFVSIFRRDKLGAKDILHKWTLTEPLNWYSHYSLGFHLFHEMQENEAAAAEILKASTLPRAPGWLSSLGVRLLSESGSAFAALDAAVRLFDSLHDEEGRHRLKLRLRSLNYALQKATWKQATIDYLAQFNRTPASLSELSKLGRNPDKEIAQVLGRLQAPPELAPLLEERFTFRYTPQSRDIEGVLSANDKELENIGVYSKKENAL